MDSAFPHGLHTSLEALTSFDRINLGSTLLQAVVALSFAAAQHGVARHFERPAMGALATLWRLLAIAAIVNIFSSWSGAVWNDRELSRALDSVVVGLLAAGIPYVKSATDALAFTDPPSLRAARLAVIWGVAIGSLHAIGVFGLAAAMPDVRVVAVTYSQVLRFAVALVPACIAWLAYARAPQQKRALRLLALGSSALAFRQAVAIGVGLSVGSDLTFEVVAGAIGIEIFGIMLFGVMSLLANTAEEVVLAERRSEMLRQAEARLADGERMESLGRLAAGVAQEFNNVLHVIRLSTASVQPTPGDPVDRTAIDETNAATRHGAVIVSQLLTFARQQPQDPKRFDVFERLRSVSPLLRRVAGTASECSIDVATGMAIVLMDPGQFEQIAINLVSNARDAITGTGRIDVRVAAVTLAGDAGRAGVRRGDYARLTVEDTGHGIPPEIRARIFEPFFTTKGVGKGSGVGLSMVHGIVQRAGGSIVVETEVGRGTRFEVYLPAVEVVRLGTPRIARSPRTPTPPFGTVGVGH